VTIANLLIVERRPQAEWNPRLGWLETVLSVGQGGPLVLAAWLSGLSARDGLLIGAVVPAAAVPLALLLIPRVPDPAVPGTGVEAGSPEAVAAATPAEAPAPAPPAAAAPAPAPSSAGRGMSPDRSERANHRLFLYRPRRGMGTAEPVARSPSPSAAAAAGGAIGDPGRWVRVGAGCLDSRVRGVGSCLLAVPVAVPACVRCGPADLCPRFRRDRLCQPAAVCPGGSGQPAAGDPPWRWQVHLGRALGAGATGVGLTVFATTVLPRRDGLWPLRRMAERESTGPAGPKNP
jgi:hypothetical protein